MSKIRRGGNADERGWTLRAPTFLNVFICVYLRASAVPVTLGVLLAAGCESITAARSDGPTGGFEMEMFVRDETGAEEYYEIKRDGTLGFGGGMAARLRNVTWTGALTSEQIAQIITLIDEHGWYERRSRTDGPREHSYQIELHGSRGQKRLRVKGRSPDIEPVRDLLRQISLARLEDDLERLPKPSGELRPEAAEERP